MSEAARPAKRTTETFPLNVGSSWLRAVSRRLEAQVYLHPLSAQDDEGRYLNWLMVPAKSQAEAASLGTRRYTQNQDGLTEFRGREQVMARLDLLPRTDAEADAMPVGELQTLLAMRQWLLEREEDLSPWEDIEATMERARRALRRKMPIPTSSDRPARGWVMVKPPNGPTGYAMELDPPLPSPDGRPWRFVAAETQADAQRIWDGMDREQRREAAILDPTLYEVLSTPGMTPTEAQALVDNAGGLRAADFQNLKAIDYADEGLRAIFEARKMPIAPKTALWMPVATKPGYGAPFLEGYAQWDGTHWNVVDAASQSDAQCKTVEGGLTVHNHVRVEILFIGWQILAMDPASKHFRPSARRYTRDELLAVVSNLSIAGAADAERVDSILRAATHELSTRDRYETSNGWVRVMHAPTGLGDRETRWHGYMVRLSSGGGDTKQWAFIEAPTTQAAQTRWESMSTADRGKTLVEEPQHYYLMPPNGVDMQSLTEAELQALVHNREQLLSRGFCYRHVPDMAVTEVGRRAQPRVEAEQLRLKLDPPSRKVPTHVTAWARVAIGALSRLPLTYFVQFDGETFFLGLGHTQEEAQLHYAQNGETLPHLEGVTFFPRDEAEAREMTMDELIAVGSGKFPGTLDTSARARAERQRRKTEEARPHAERQAEAEARLASPGDMSWPKGARPEDRPDLTTTLPLGAKTPQPELDLFEAWVPARRTLPGEEPTAGFLRRWSHNPALRRHWFYLEGGSREEVQRQWAANENNALARGVYEVSHPERYTLSPTTQEQAERMTSAELVGIQTNLAALAETFDTIQVREVTALVIAALARRSQGDPSAEERPQATAERGVKWDGNAVDTADALQRPRGPTPEATGEVSRQATPMEELGRHVEEGRPGAHSPEVPGALRGPDEACRAQREGQGTPRPQPSDRGMPHLPPPGTDPGSRPLPRDWREQGDDLQQLQPDARARIRHAGDTPTSGGVSGEVGRKYDGRKPRWSLMQWDALESILDVLERGAHKYAPDNWLKVEDARTRYFNATMRHMTKWWGGGERLDPEWNTPHLAHAACCVGFLLAMELRGMFDPPTQPTPANPQAPTPEKEPSA